MIKNIVLNGADPESQVSFWTAATGDRCAGSDAHYAVLVPRTGSSPPLLLQRVSEPSPPKASDLHADGLESEVTLQPHDECNSRWMVMTDPEETRVLCCEGPSQPPG
jgi:hypothetical protein